MQFQLPIYSMDRSYFVTLDGNNKDYLFIAKLRATPKGLCGHWPMLSH